MRSVRIYLAPWEKKPLICSLCGRMINLPSVIKSEPVIVVCSCGNHFVVNRDVRKEYRKSVMLSGNCEIPGEGKTYHVTIENLSFSGACFRSPVARKLKRGDFIQLTFELRDRRRSLISRSGIVKHITNDKVGVEWADRKQYDKALACFLLP